MDVMLDLETMGNGAEAAIVAIGAVEFDIQNRTTGRSFYAVVSLDSAVAGGGIMDPATVIWWLQQSDDARKLFTQPTQTIVAALTDFAAWLGQCGPVDDLKIWGNGAAFDNVILSSAYRRAGIPQPWQFRNDRCYRTLKSLHKDIKMQRQGVHHNALDDAMSQAQHLIDIFATLET